MRRIDVELKRITDLERAMIFSFMRNEYFIGYEDFITDVLNMTISELEEAKRIIKQTELKSIHSNINLIFYFKRYILSYSFLYSFDGDCYLRIETHF